MAEAQHSANAFANAILSRISSACIARFGRDLQPVALEMKQDIYRPNEPIQHAYFPESGMLSVVSTMKDGRSVEVGTIGREGMSGGTLLYGTDSFPYHCYVQIEGRGHRINAAILKNAARRDENLHELILKYQASFLVQTMQGTACNALHSVSERCCRWLLMSHDRVDSDRIPLTHEFIALMLGVRRASVTDHLQPLQARGWIQMTRGEITILGRKSLESGSCECYRIISEQQYKFDRGNASTRP
jgi:CRP-like cAMP-binding protein